MSGKIDRNIAQKILGWNYRKVLRYFESGKIKSASRKSSAPQAPWQCDRSEIEGLKNANSAR